MTNKIIIDAWNVCWKIPDIASLIPDNLQNARKKFNQLVKNYLINKNIKVKIGDMIKAGEITQSRREILEDSADIILGSAREKLDEAGLSDVTSEYITGDPASGIAEYAEQKGVDLVVIGYHGLGPHGDLLGGVARKLTNICTTSCLVVR